MKKMLFSLLAACSFFLVGCLETTQEVTINEDGSGTASYTTDMSALIGMLKQMGSGEDLKEMNQVLDSTIAMSSVADSISDLSDSEKALMKKGEMKIEMDMKNEKFLTKLNFPFGQVTDITSLNQLSGKVVGEALKGQGGMNGLTGDGGSPQMSTFEEYFKTVYTNGRIERTLIKEKYEKVGEDEFFKSMKEAASMGLGMKANYIINLPRPASKAEGKGITLSEDKKKITIAVDMDDFFDEPAKFEYLIEY
jgi:hypothetical protein